MTGLPEAAKTDHAAEALAELPDATVKVITEPLAALIAARESGIRYAESRLNSLALVSGGFIAAGIALLSLGLNQSSRTQAMLIAAAFGLLGLAVLLLFVYARSTNPRYPFIDDGLPLKQARWKWFYRDALPDPDRFATMNWLGLQGRKRRSAEITETNQQFPAFVDAMIEGLSEPKANAADDLRQLYTLHINERYKNQYLSNVRRILMWGLVLLATLVAGAGAIATQVERATNDGAESSTSSAPGYTYEVTWSEVSRSNGLVTLTLHIEVQNQRGRNLVVSMLAGLDKNGVDLPMTTTLGTETVGPRDSRRIDTEATIPASYVEAVDSWRLE